MPSLIEKQRSSHFLNVYARRDDKQISALGGKVEDIGDITEEADGVWATFYMHYKDKDDLLSTVVEKFYQDVIAQLASG